MIIVAYDIEIDRVRNKIAKMLLKYGQRVQYSVFEIECSQDELLKLIYRIKRIINVGKDSIIIYFCCENCRQKNIVVGLDKRLSYDDAYVF